MMAMPALVGDPSDIIRSAYLRACELELTSLKPGNVHVYGDGHGMTVEDFRHSATASSIAISTAGRSLGERIYQAIAATSRVVSSNTNLGIVLLCAPIAQAVWESEPADRWRESLPGVLLRANIQDTESVFSAIRLASPGGLGSSADHDVFGRARAPLREVMALAAGRDRVAYQYAHEFSDVLTLGMQRLLILSSRWGSIGWAATAIFMEFLAHYPDTHIERKLGRALALRVSVRAAKIASRLSDSDAPEEFKHELLEFDRELKRAGINPGTTADLTVASLFAVFLDELLSVVPNRKNDPADAPSGRVV